MNEFKRHFIIRVAGKVQGVWFRKSAKQKATELGLFGFAKNNQDGTVIIEIEGDIEKILHFSEWCKVGSDRANVEEITLAEETLVGFSDFKIY